MGLEGVTQDGGWPWNPSAWIKGIKLSVWVRICARMACAGAWRSLWCSRMRSRGQWRSAFGVEGT